MTPINVLIKNLNNSITAKIRSVESNVLHQQFSDAAEILISCYKSGKKVLIAGNGGSAADAQHLAAEFVSKLARDRAPLPAEALTVDTSILTAIGNDYGYDQVFARQILGKADAGDIFLAITTSGNSENIIAALKACKTKKIKSILLSAHNGGQALEFADYPILVPGIQTSTIQEVHLVVEHSLCELVENAIFGE